MDIVKDPKKAKKLISRPQYKGFQILDEEITIVQSQKKIIKLDKPIACGFSVLENAKYAMGDFWYNVLKPKYGERIKLILSDTDSFIYGVYTNDAYEDMYQIRHLLDLSGYNENTPLGKFYDSSNRKVPGKFSDEKPQEIIREVIALKPKMYSLLTKKLICKEQHTCNKSCYEGGSITAKGITKTAQRGIFHKDYLDVLTEKTTTMTSNKTIKSIDHNMYLISIKKRGLSCFDDKNIFWMME